MSLVDDSPGFGPRVPSRPPRGPRVGRRRHQPGHLQRRVPDVRELTEDSGPLEDVLAVAPSPAKRSDGYPPRGPGRSSPTPDDLGAAEQRRGASTVVRPSAVRPSAPMPGGPDLKSRHVMGRDLAIIATSLTGHSGRANPIWSAPFEQAILNPFYSRRDDLCRQSTPLQRAQHNAGPEKNGADAWERWRNHWYVPGHMMRSLTTAEHRSNRRCRRRSIGFRKSSVG